MPIASGKTYKKATPSGYGKKRKTKKKKKSRTKKRY